MPATTVTTLIYEIIWDDGEAAKKRDAWDRKLHESSKTVQLLQKAFLEAGKAIKDYIINAGKNFAIFEDALGHARRTMGLSRDETLALGDALMDLSTSFEDGGLKAGVTSNELAKISGILGQLGFSSRENTDQFLRLATVVAKVGTAFGMSSQKAAEGLGILRNLYDLPIENIEKAASSIAYLGNSTVATAQDVMTVMVKMGGIAGLLGVTAQEAAALAATLRESGVAAGLAGTSMSQIFSRMASDVDRFGEVLKKGGVSGEMLRMAIESGKATDALKMVLQGLRNIQAREGKIAATQALKDLGLSGVRVQQTLLALSNDLAGFNKNLAASEKAFRENIAVNDAYQAAIDNVAKKWVQFKNLLDVIQKLVGKDLALVFGDFLDKYLIPFVDRFKDWIKTSEGAKAIFGKDGLIATGLQGIGELLSKSGDTIFNWLDHLDTDIAFLLKKVQKYFEAAWEKIMESLQHTGVAFQTFYTTLQDIVQAIRDIQEAWKIFIETIKGSLQTLEKIGKPLQYIVEPIARMNEEAKRMKEIYGDMPNEIYKSNEAINEFVNGTQAATAAGQEMGDVFVYKSVLPDITTATIALTEKTLQLGSVYKAQTDHMKNIYQVGENTFTNLSRDVQHYHDVFQNSGWKANSSVQYYLTQTGEAVGQLGVMYQQMGEDAEKSAQKIIESTQAIQEMTVREMMGFSEAIKATQPRAKSTITGEQWQNLTAAQVADLWQRPGLMTASGIHGAIQSQQTQAGQEYLSASSQYAPAEVLEATFVFGDQEIGHMRAALQDRSHQDQRRAFGARPI